MKTFAVIGFILGLLIIVGALLFWRHLKHPSDAVVRQNLTGTWSPVLPASSPVETTTDINSNGSFSTKVTIVHSGLTNRLAYEGSWDVQDGFVTFTITNALEGDLHDAGPPVQRFKVVQMNSHEIVTQQDGQKHLNKLERR